MFWLNGLTGIGKFTIAQTVAERTHERGLLALSRGDSELTDPSLVLPTLAFQLAQFDKTIKRRIVAAAVEKDLDAGHLVLSQQLKELVIAPLGPLVADDRPIILSSWTPSMNARVPAPESSCNFSSSSLISLDFPSFESLLVITSRPERHIRPVFSQEQNHSKVVLHECKHRSSVVLSK